MIDNLKHSKRQQKNSKILQKQIYDLSRDVQAMNRRQRDKNHNQSQQQYQFVDKKAIRWWTKIDQKYFNHIQQEDVKDIQDITTVNYVLQQSGQNNYLNHYSDYKIVNQYDCLADKNLIHAFFINKKISAYSLCSYQLEDVIPNYSQFKKDKEYQDNIKITVTNQKSVSKKNNIDESDIKQIKLDLVCINDDEQFGKRALQYKDMIKKHSDKNEVDREIYLWETQLAQTNQLNQTYLNKLKKSIKYNSQKCKVAQSQIKLLKEQLMWATVLKCLQIGLPDKTMQMLQSLIQSYKLIRPAKSKDSNNKKFFETDCKICFCSLNSDCNQVLYCDKCNTSFHLACYGLQEIPKQQLYYCDLCKFEKENEKTVCCQICNKTRFPIKDINGHFYHATCLLLLNLVHIKAGSLMLRQGINHKKIIEMVVNSEIQNSQCQFCLKNSGFRFRCTSKGCNNSSHPICAYLNGCRYDVRRDKKNQILQVSYKCNHHDPTRNWIQQIYIRRYMCNLNETADLSLKDFLINFQKDKEKQAIRTVPNYKWNTSKIINKTNMIKKMMNKQQNKGSQSNQVSTQAGRMLQKLKSIKQGK